MGERRGVYRVLVGKSEGKVQLGDPSVNMRIILRWLFLEVGCVDMVWVELAQVRNSWRELVSAVMNLRVP